MGIFDKFSRKMDEKNRQSILNMQTGYEIEKLRSHLIHFQKSAINEARDYEKDQSVRDEAKKDQLLVDELLKAIQEHKFETADDFRRIYRDKLARLTKKYGLNDL